MRESLTGSTTPQANMLRCRRMWSCWSCFGKAHLGDISVKEAWLENRLVVVTVLVESFGNFFPLKPLLNLPESSMYPGCVISWSLSFTGLDNISTTWDMVGLRPAAACVQKRATLIYLITCSSGYPFIFGPTNSVNLFPSKSSHACKNLHLLVGGMVQESIVCSEACHHVLNKWTNNLRTVIVIRRTTRAANPRAITKVTQPFLYFLFIQSLLCFKC